CAHCAGRTPCAPTAGGRDGGQCMDIQLTGPDLEQGISLDQLPDGAMLGGHAGGEAVLLVRRGGEIYAIGGTCTHYGGPLGEGLVRRQTLPRPVPPASFDPRTGAAAR